MRIKERWRAFRDWAARSWALIRPGREARRGALWGAFLVAFAIALVGGIYLQSGFGLAIDLAFAFTVALLGVPVVALIVWLLMTFAAQAAALFFRHPGRRLRSRRTRVVSAVRDSLRRDPAAGRMHARRDHRHFARRTFSRGAPQQENCHHRAVHRRRCGECHAYLFLHNTGTDKDVLRIGQVSSPDPQPLAEPDPANVGQNPVLTTFYGSGSDLRRSEYGKSVAIKTKTIDGSLFFKDFKGWKRSCAAATGASGWTKCL